MFEDIQNEVKLQNKQYPFLSTEELLNVLGLTIKKDRENKLATFLCELSAYSGESQFNISFQAPSSTGKSYIPLEIAKLFPKEDVLQLGYASPTSFFHTYTSFDKENKEFLVDLRKKIIIFLDMPHSLLLQHLRPLLSHDKKEILVQITDRSKRQLRAKKIRILGYPSVIFCSASLKLDEQESTRFLLLSPQVDQEKIRQAIIESVKREMDKTAYDAWLEADPRRIALKERIAVIKATGIQEVRVADGVKIQEKFLSEYKFLKPRHSRDIKRLLALTKAFALLNLWERRTQEENIIETKPSDFEAALSIWKSLSESQELNLPPYVFELYQKVLLPLNQPGVIGITLIDFAKKHFEVYGRYIPDWQMKREILPMLCSAGLITLEKDPADNRRRIIQLIQ